MRTSIVGTSGLALILIVPMLTAWPTAAAPAVDPSEAPTVLRTLLTDVTGDGRLDRVELTSAGTNRYRLTVTAAGSGKTSAVEFSSTPSSTMDADAALYGAAAIDGVKGMELIVQRWSPSAVETSDPVDLTVYTWRGGTLVAEKAPKGGWVSGWHFGDPWAQAQGYRFFDKGGHRYVDVSALRQQTSGKFLWVGKITRSVWRKGAWVKVSTRTVRLTEAKAHPYLRYDGPYLLKSILKADIDGDSQADELRFYAYQDTGFDGKYRLKVTTATAQVATKKFSAIIPDPLIGVAGIDGAAGGEILLYVSYDQPTWRVFTWRKGKLSDEPGPARCGSSAGGGWQTCGEELFTQITFSVVDGVHYVEYLTTWDPWEEGQNAHIDRSVWQSGRWVKVSSRSETISAEQFASLCSGFCGVTITTP